MAKNDIFLFINQLLWKNNLAKNARKLFYYTDTFLLKQKNCIEGKNGLKKTVLIIYNLALGDGVMFYEIMKKFRQLFPKDNYEITMVCQRGLETFFESTGVFDEVIPLSFTEATVNLSARKKLFYQLRKKEYDFLINPIGCEDCSTNVLMTRAACAKKKIGVLDTTLKNRQCSRKMRNAIYNEVIYLNTPEQHLIEFYTEFLSSLGHIDLIPMVAELPQQEINIDIPEEYFIVFPLASMAVKRWDLDRFAFLTRKIYEKLNIPLLLCGTNGDMKTVKQFLELIPGIPVYNIVGETSIMEFCSVIGRAKFVLSNDTSAYHIAVAQNRPTALICGGYTYHRYAYYKFLNQDRIKPLLITDTDHSCFDCKNHCKYSSYTVYPCIDKINAEYAWSQIVQYFGKEGID